MAQLLAQTFADLPGSTRLARWFRAVGQDTQPATAMAFADMVMKSRAHAGSKKVAPFCTLLGWRLLPFDAAERPFGVEGS